MLNRKKFFKISSVGLASLVLPKWTIGHTKSDVIDDSNNLMIDQIRSSFSLDKDLIFLNNGTMGPSPKPVAAALLEGLEDITVHALYNRRKVEALDNLASFIGCSKDELVLTHNTTEGINMMVWGMALKAGDEILISEQEHIGNAGPWLHRANLEKLLIKTVPVGKNAEESFALVKKATTPKTRVIALPHIPCTNGQILPIKEICTFAKSKNIITCIDGAHPTGMLQLNVKELGVDYYASCCHKWLLAAQGTGYLYINKEKLDKIKPTFFGAEGTVVFKTIGGKPSLIEKKDSAQIFQFGTQSGALAASITAAVQFQNSLGKKNIETHIKKCSKYLAEGLQAYKKHLSILTPLEDKSRGGIIAFQFNKLDNKKFYDKLYAEKIVIRYVGENDLDSLRVSTHIYNNTAQIDELLVQVKKYIG
jgi:selenocysteine lyase/cysteine desulfurase